MKKSTSKPIDTCGVAYSLSLIGGKWKPLILWRLIPRTLRFSELKRQLPAVTERVLIRQLKELEASELVERIVYKQLPPKVEYRLTAKAQSLVPLLYMLEQWGKDIAKDTRPVVPKDAAPSSQKL